MAGGSVVERFGSDELEQRRLPGIASGETVMAFAITEPNAGSDSHNISVNAKKVGG
ncbi:hypothetical protein [Pseudonocardia sp. WMMC193]|uniref:hypothetical protein n=1 Tax=Pseudonocardia sp. WMMC193 TaxID=2911965 RepID=UPI0035AC1EA9